MCKDFSVLEVVGTSDSASLICNLLDSAPLKSRGTLPPAVMGPETSTRQAEGSEKRAELRSTVKSQMCSPLKIPT